MIFRVDDNGLMYRINIPSQDEDIFLKAQVNGNLKYIKVKPEELPKYDGDLKLNKLFYKKVNNDLEIDYNKTIHNWIDDKYKQIENIIYSKYPQPKQNSDLADKLYFENLLKTKTDSEGNRVYPDLEAVVVPKIVAVAEGAALGDQLADVAEEDKAAIEQLIKVGVRVSWVQRCKAELKAAIAQKREPTYPEYPKL